MRVSSANGIFSSSLYKAYFGGESSSASLSKGSQVNSDAIVSQLGDVKSKLLSLAAKSKQLTERERASDTEVSGPALPPTYSTPDDVEVSVSTENGNKPRRFERQVSNALAKNFNSPDKRLLNDKKLSGDVKVTLKDGEDTESFTIRVDKDTTVQSFVDEFNQKANGKAEAEINQTTVNGKSKFKINLVGSPGTPVEIDDEESEAAERIANEADAAQFEKDVKDFIGDVNKLVSAVAGNGDGLASLDSNVGLLDSLKDLVKNLKSDDGSVSLSSFVTEKSNGGFVVNGSAAREAFLNNSDGVINLLDNLSDAVSGKKGLTQSYAAYGGSLDKISSVVKVIGEAQDKYNSDGLSSSTEIRAQREQNLQELVSYAGRLSSQKAS